MSIHSRIKELRKEHLHLTQVEFGKRVGAAGSTVTGWEKYGASPSESAIKMICKEFNVNYAWLVYGEGDIFNTIEQTLIDRLVDEYQLNNIQRRIIEAVLELSDDEINSFTNKFFGFDVIKEDHQD